MSMMTVDERAARVHPRACGDCKLCCKLLPVQDLHPANTWCPHANTNTDTNAPHAKGCKIYNNRPLSCKAFACMWLADKDFLRSHNIRIRRPDICHYVLDESADIVYINNTQFACLQVWADPKFPNAWRVDKELKKLMSLLGTHRNVTMIRNGDADGICVVPPTLGPDRRWIERKVRYTKNPTTEAEKMEFFNKVR